MHGRFHDNTKYSMLQNTEKFALNILHGSHLRVLAQIWITCCLETAASLKLLSGRLLMKGTGVRTAVLNEGNAFTHQKNPILPMLSSTEVDFYFVRVV